VELNAGDIGLPTGGVQAGGPLALPRYQLAARQQRLLKAILAACVVLIAGMLALWWYQILPAWQPVLVAQTAMVVALTASLQRVWWITRWRVRALNAASQGVTAGRGAELQAGQSLTSQFQINPVEPGVALSLFTRCCAGLRARWIAVLIAIQQHGDGLAALGVGLLASAALLLVAGNWNWQPSPSDNLYAQAPAKFLMAFSLLLLAFATLVLERHYSSVRSSSHSNELPEAPQIACQLRVVISVSLLLCIAVLLGNETRQWPLRALVWIGLLPTAVAVELLLRAVLSLFAPPSQQEPELLAESLLATLWRWPIKPFAHFQDELKQRFGIDLRQSWAFAYIRRALLPVVAVLLGVAWLLSGLFEIPIAERGIYERFGAPVAVWQPGIHWGLPWPLSHVQSMENGVVHELSAAAGDQDLRSDPIPEPTAAEGLPPASANRLWDASHVAEKSQIIASEVSTGAGNRQSFHIVNMDVRFMYRIGLSDGAALKGCYTSADAPALIRSAANRILVRYFASRTLEGVLGETRTRMAADIGSQLQADLDTLNSGIEIMTTVLEAIHPPAAAANAYHAVQAAQINAQAIISRERGNSAQQVNLAQLRAGIARDQATAAARETLAVADVAKRRFIAERDAYQQGGKAFLMEQYFAQLAQGLSNARVVLVDHRLPAASTTIDLRDFSAAVDSGAVNNARPVAASTAAQRKVDYQGSP
jgi:regulator of protease activity HflC (stomatin/prohibitin superfamily)